jgi:hypothetical protein
METEMSCLFVYGLVDTDEWIDGGAALRQAISALPGVDPMGEPAVVTIGQLGVLVSQVPLAAFSGARFEANLDDMAWIEPRVRAHATVNSMAISLQSLLPMRFGTLFSGMDSLAAELCHQERIFLGELTAMRGLEEWNVRVCGNTERLIEQMVSQVKAGAETAGQGAQYLLRRRLAVKGRPEMMGNLIAKAEEAHTLLEPLARHALAARMEVGGLPGGQRSLVSRIYVIKRDQRHAFLARIERVAEMLAGDGLTIMHSGPWPPARAGALG